MKKLNGSESKQAFGFKFGNKVVVNMSTKALGFYLVIESRGGIDVPEAC